jgi:hypothetical protein
MNHSLQIQSDSDNHSLVIPVDPATLGSFISGLLGRPQTIENRFFGNFDLNRDHIVDIYHLVNQRISQQNKGQLVQFTVTIVYSDESSVLLNSLSDFESYRDVNDKISVAAELSWTYLIKFEDRPTPEKQVIELAIKTAQKEEKLVGVPIDVLLPSVHRLRHSFFLRIQHTARTWGADIEHLIAGKINTWIKKEHWFPKFIHTYYGLVGFVMGLVFLAITLFGIFAVAKPLEQAYLEAAKQATTLSIDQKINYLISQASAPTWKHFEDVKFGACLVALLVSFILGLIVAFFADNPPKSFLVLSAAAETERENLLKARKLDWAYFAVSAVTSTAAGVASRYIFKVFFEG